MPYWDIVHERYRADLFSTEQLPSVNCEVSSWVWACFARWGCKVSPWVGACFATWFRLLYLYFTYFLRYVVPSDGPIFGGAVIFCE